MPSSISLLDSSGQVEELIQSGNLHGLFTAMSDTAPHGQHHNHHHKHHRGQGKGGAKPSSSSSRGGGGVGGLFGSGLVGMGGIYGAYGSEGEGSTEYDSEGEYDDGSGSSSDWTDVSEGELEALLGQLAGGPRVGEEEGEEGAGEGEGEGGEERRQQQRLRREMNLGEDEEHKGEKRPKSGAVGGLGDRSRARGAQGNSGHSAPQGHAVNRGGGISSGDGGHVDGRSRSNGSAGGIGSVGSGSVGSGSGSSGGGGAPRTPSAQAVKDWMTAARCCDVASLEVGTSRCKAEGRGVAAERRGRGPLLRTPRDRGILVAF